MPSVPGGAAPMPHCHRAAWVALLLLAAAPAAAQTAVSFTQEQAQRGEQTYRRDCQDCHGPNLDDGEFGGAPLRGSYFAQHWGSGTAGALIGYLKLKMPPDRPGRLSPQSYADVAAYLLSRNGYVAGASELPVEDAGQQAM